MKCKTGDLAVIIRADYDPDALGRIVTVKNLRIAMGDLAWQVDPPHFWTSLKGVMIEVMLHDGDLQPIRGSGINVPRVVALTA